MATGGIFQLITNDGKQDRMLMATALLKQRLEAAVRDRTDKTATLYDIERTHILFTNAHFKPFAAIGYEYNKVTPSGSVVLGAENIQFSIPQFGDFFNDMIVHATISQPKLETATNPDPTGSTHNTFRWCNYPGERLLKKVKFEVNGNPLDEYTSDSTNFHREFQVQPNKQVGWERCVGQEEVELGHMDQPNWAHSDVDYDAISHRMCSNSKSGNQTPTGKKTEDLEMFIPLLFWMNKDPRLSIPSVAIPYGQRYITVDLCSQAELVGEYVRGGTKWADYESKGKLTPSNIKLDLYINNIFVNPDIHNIFIKRIGFTLIRVHKRQDYTTGQTSNSLLLQQLKWPIETLYVGLRVEKYTDTSGSAVREHLDKWHRFCSVDNKTRVAQGWCSTKKSVMNATNWAAFVAYESDTTKRPTNLTLTGLNAAGGADLAATLPTTTDMTNLFKVGSEVTMTGTAAGVTHTFHGKVKTSTATSVKFEDKQYLGAVATAFNAFTNLATTAGFTIKISNSEESPSSTVAVCTPTVTAITIKAHGIPIYNDFPAKFFNAYMPYNYGGPNIRTPNDPGAMMINFCLYPGTYQPSGHINISRAREFYIDFTCVGTINESNKGKLIVVASAINFLLISDGSAVLRYST